MESVKPAGPEERRQTEAVILLAFAQDPLARWLYPEPHDYATYFPRFIDGFGGPAFAAGTAFCTADAAGAALWLPPGVHPDEEGLARLYEESMDDALRARAYGVLEKSLEYHPEEPHWYLTLMAVDPARQGEGRGTALLRHTLARLDEQGDTAYLEASSEGSRRFYQRHGFEVVGTVQDSSSPPMYAMVRGGAGG